MNNDYPHQYARAVQSNEELASLLTARNGGRTGPEMAVEWRPDVHIYRDSFGSYRLVKLDKDNFPVAAIQVMSPDGQQGVVANAYTHPDFRRRGYAADLVKIAQRLFSPLAFSEDRSGDGAAFVSSVEKKSGK